MNAATSAHDLPTSVALWVAAGLAMPPDMDERLRAGGAVLAVDCGAGLGCMALAEAYPAARIVGHDRDAAAIARARTLAEAAGASVTFAVGDAERLPRATYDLAALQDLSRRPDPLRVLNAVRNALHPDGVCLLVERARVPAEALRTLARQAGFSRWALLCRGNVSLYELRR